MQTTIRRPTRTAAEAEPYPIDGCPGWFLDPWGFESYSPTLEAEAQALDVARAKPFLLLETDDVPPPPLITTVAIGGRLPAAEQVERRPSRACEGPGDGRET